MKRMGSLTIVILFLLGVPAIAQTVPTVPNIGKAPLRPVLNAKRPVSSLSDLSGTWWRTPANVRLFSLTTDQQKKMDDVFQESRVRLITLDADLKVQEAMLEPLMAAERLDEAKTLAQIDRVAQARAELEKANAKMLLGIRQVMTSEQRAVLQRNPSNANDWVSPKKWKLVQE